MRHASVEFAAFSPCHLDRCFRQPLRHRVFGGVPGQYAVADQMALIGSGG
jgi:hypothetical protein